MSLIKDIIVIICVFVLCIVVSVEITGSPGLGIGALFVFLVAQSTREKMQNKKQ